MSGSLQLETGKRVAAPAATAAASSPTGAPLISTHGPRLLEDLKLDTEVSKAKVKVYFMGHTNLYYLPPTLRPQVMNVGNPSIGTYDVPLLATDIMKPLPNGEGTLISNIKKNKSF